MSAAHTPTVIAIVGPTGSGKTSLSLYLAEAFGAEIIACDSRTVYRHFDVGTAKPTAAEQEQIRHHLIDVVEPEENFTAAQFVTLAKEAISDIYGRGKVPIVCGGTGFYARALLEGLAIPAVGPQEDLREQLRAFAQANGNEALHARLKQVDPVTAERLGVNDLMRVIRAIEVYETTGRPFSEVASRVAPPYRTIWIGLTAEDRSFLHKGIDERFQIQLKDGLLAEARRLYERYGSHQKLLHTVNYRQLVEMFESGSDEQAAYREAIQHNVQLARKQLIWFRSNKNINWFSIDKSPKPELHASVRAYIDSCLQKNDF